MAKVDCRPTIQALITIQMSEDEAAALDALAGYGVDAFLKVFYEHLGQAYLKPHERGLRSLFESVQRGNAGVRLFLGRAKAAREVFANGGKANEGGGN